MTFNSQFLLTRRSLLKKGLFGGLLLAAGGGTVLALRGGKREAPPDLQLQVLDLLEYSVFCAVAARLVPVPGALSPRQVSSQVDVILTRAQPGARREVKQLLRLLNNGLLGFLFDGRPAPFVALSPSEQEGILKGWRDSRILLRRTGYQALRTLALAGYYSSPLSWPETAYPGPPQGFHEANAPVWRGGERKLRP